MNDVAGPALAWEDPPQAPSSSGVPVLSVDGFEGPLDWLLELARAERIDLRKLSILALVEAFGRALEQALVAPMRLELSHWGEFLSMAAQLALLRSRLLVPPGSVAAQAGQREAEAFRHQLLEREALHRAASWLGGRVQLGREVFGRGVADAEKSATSRGLDIVDLFRACLVVLRVPELAEQYAPPIPTLWRVPDAIARITWLLAEGVEGELLLYLPRLGRDAPDRALQCRAAVASTLVAGLELARNEAASLTQNAPWAAIELTRADRLGRARS